MARVKRAVGARKHRKATLKKARGYYGMRSRSARFANEQNMRSGQYAFRDRRAKKSEFRRLWIQRINAATRQHDLTRTVNAQVEAGSARAPEASIDETPRAIQTILADWRDAERRAIAAESGSAEAAEANALVDRLRDEYRRAHDAAARDQ